MSVQDRLKSVDWVRVFEIVLKYWYVFALAGIVIYMTANQYCNSIPPDPDQPTVPPVDYTVDQNRLECYSRRAPDDIVRTCNQVPGGERMNCYGQLLPDEVIEVCNEAFDK